MHDMGGVARRGRSGVEVNRWEVVEAEGVVRRDGVDEMTSFTHAPIESYS